MAVSGWSNFSCAALLACAALSRPALGAPPVPDVVRDADIAIGYEPKRECPDLAHADSADRSAALVLFLVGPTGVPSKASVKSSSGSQSLDSAAMSCVLKLRFLPAVHSGDGNAIDSWQEIAWKWGRSHADTANGGTAAPTASATASATMGVSAAPATAASGTAGAAEARICLDASGAVTQQPVISRSSGDSGLDGAALQAARAASPGTGGRGGCLRVTVTPER